MVNPLRYDPTRTATLRRNFEEEFSRVFSKFFRDIRDYLENDLQDLTVNVFCPTGKGGGVDPTCSPKGKKQTETKAFKKWFGKSKIVDDEGKPLVVYHGSRESFSKFKVSNGSYFTDDPKYAEHYTKLKTGTLDSKGDLPQIYPVYLKAENPKFFGVGWDKTGKFDTVVKEDNFRILTPEKIQAYKDQGYDALILRIPKSPSGMLELGFSYREIIVFDSTQIKSAIGNKGTFDPNDPLISNARNRFEVSEDRVKAFEQWIISKLTETFEKKDYRSGLNWWELYIRRAYQEAAGRAFDQMNANSTASKEVKANLRRQFIASSLNSELSVERLKLLVGRTYRGMKGLTEAMKGRLTHDLAEGMIRGDSPKTIAKDLMKHLGFTKHRANVIARTEIVRAHNSGTLVALKNLGVSEVGVDVEFTTAGKPCPTCLRVRNKKKYYTVEEAEGILPVHPQCKCAWVPRVKPFSQEKSRKRSLLEQTILTARK